MLCVVMCYIRFAVHVFYVVCSYVLHQICCSFFLAFSSNSMNSFQVLTAVSPTNEECVAPLALPCAKDNCRLTYTSINVHYEPYTYVPINV